MVANQQRIVELGRKPGMTLTRAGREVPMQDWATTLINEMRPIADLLDDVAAYARSPRYMERTTRANRRS